MKRTQIYLDVDQDRRLGHRATATGTTKSTLIREAIETYLSDSETEIARLARFRDALDAAERKPLNLAEGRSFLERIREADEHREEDIEHRRR